MNKYVAPSELPSYLDQPSAVRARFDRLKAREVILKVEHLSKTFATGKRETLALNDISFQTHRREFLCVVGPSGCGKSTLVRILAGLEDYSDGDVLLLGEPVTEPGSDRGMVFQGYTLFPWLTVKKNVMFGLEVNGKGRHEAETQALQWLQLIGLEKFADSYPHQFSGRHEAAGGDRARARQPAAHPADGRAVRRARRADARAHAGASAGDLAQDRHHHRVHHPRPRRGDLPRRPHPGAVGASGRGAGTDRGAGAASAQHRAVHLAGIPRHQGAAGGADPPGRRATTTRTPTPIRWWRG